MFNILDYYAGKIILAAVILLILIAAGIYGDNKQIDKHNERIKDDIYLRPLPKAPFGLIVVVIVFLCIALITPVRVSDERYDALQEAKDELELQYEELKESVSSAYDSTVALKFYLKGYDDVSASDADEAIKKIYDVLYPGEY